MKSWLNVTAVLVALFSTVCQAGEIGFVEDFALAPDRTVPLGQLIPGTDDYYYFHCLHYQNTQQHDKVDDLLSTWIKRHGQTQRVKEIQIRQALLTYDRNPLQSLEFIRRQLNLHFNHQRETIGFQPNLPTRLNQNLIARETLMRRALNRYRNLQGFEDSALDWLVAIELNPDQRRDLIRRLARPDQTNLPRVIASDLAYRNSRGFGSATIHRRLLLDQLNELVRLRPNLRNQTHFVNTYLARLRPANDVDWRHDAQAYTDYLHRLWAFVGRLAPAHNSLKAHVLYHRLLHDQSQGTWNKQRFMTYIALPRNVSYINSDYMKLDQNRRYAADLNVDFRAHTLLPPVGNDEPLVRSYLHHFFVTETSYKQYEEYINDIYLKYNFAECKIVNGLGEPEQWYSMLPPERYQQLKERIDLEFAPTNRKLFGPNDPVSLDLYVKNVESLIVKVFEINTANFYRQQLREIDTDVNLDGLVANQEQTFTYSEPQLRRVKRHFEFPSLAGRGVYVIDFIGNGKSSRALVRKGKLRYLVRTSTAGHTFTVMDENNRRLDDAKVWLDGHEYQAEDGLITVPFSSRPGSQPIVLSHGGFSTLDRFNHQAEKYRLRAGIYVDRESLLTRQKAQVIIRPVLHLNGTPVTLSVLEDIKLVLTSTDLDGVSTSKEISDFELFEDRESLYEFQTPARLQSITFTVRAKVQSLSENKKIDLSASQSFALNEIDKSDKIQDLHFGQIDGDYFLDVLGKNGEVKPDQQINLSIKHRDFRNPVTVALQSDRQGRVDLGPLREIAQITAHDPRGTSHTWQLRKDSRTQYRSIHAKAGEIIRIPCMGKQSRATRDAFSLLELRGQNFFEDRFSAISVQDGFLGIRGLPAGDFDLLMKEAGTAIKLRVSAGAVRDGYILSKNRQLELRGSKPLQISGVEVGDDALSVQLVNATKFARVHVLATRYRPIYSVMTHLGRAMDAEPYVLTLPKSESAYVAGRNIGDEIRYIIDRKYAKKYPGNMLERPSVLLSPWALRSTQTGQQTAAVGDAFGGGGAGRKVGADREGLAAPAAVKQENFANLDFLQSASVVLANLTADDDGRIRIERSLLGPHQQVHVVACDPLTTVYREVSFAELPIETQDLRLANGLDPSKHFTQQKQTTVVGAGGELVIPDITTARFEAYDSLARVYSVFVTLSNSPQLVEFGFLLNWPNLSAEEKRTQFSKYACHELAFFIHEKDREFFDAEVRPFLQNKKDKTFLDHWLLQRDVRRYVRPWDHAQRNIVEQILIGRRIDAESQFTARHVDELFDVIPPNVDRMNFLFDVVVKGSALDTSDRYGFSGAKSRELSLQLQQQQALESKLAERGGSQRQMGGGGSVTGEAAAGQRLDFDDLQRRPDAADAPAAPSAEPMEELSKDEAEGVDLLDSLGDRGLSRRSGVAGAYFGSDKGRRERARPFYQKLDQTKEWAENNYYNLPIEQQNAQHVTVNAFWNDYAQHDHDEPFFSVHFAEASRSFTEMMLALAVLDLPFDSPEHSSDFDGPKMTLSTSGPMIAFHEEIKPTGDFAGNTPILVSQNFFRNDDRYRYENNQRFDKYVTDEFVVHTVYGCQVVVTNPTSSPRKLDLLLQIPMGAMPVLGGKATRSVHTDLGPYSTQTHEYHFYFPKAGQFRHYPVHVSQNQELVAFAERFDFNVVNEPTKIDRQSWAYISQHGSREDVLQYLRENNLQRTNLEKIAFRLADKRFFQTIVDLLTERHFYNHTVWSYGIKHDVASAVREYLQHADDFVARCGSYIDSPLLKIDPVARKTYQHLEYRPLVNARVHQLGRRRKILNDRLARQYDQTMRLLCYRRELNHDDLMAVTYYMLLQERIEEALEYFSRVQPDQLATRLQYDYFDAYLAFYLEDTSRARAIADRYVDHPVDRWRNVFAEVRSQLDEIDGANVAVVDSENRAQIQTQLAATQPSFAFSVESQQVRLDYQNLDQILVNYYLMDIELLFSRNPFVQQFSGQFSFITPNQTAVIDLPKDKSKLTFDLPKQLTNQNVLVEITAAGQTKSQAYYSNSLSLQVIENYGQVRVASEEFRRPVSKAYVKVYAQMQDGSTRFYKDGYTDLRGRFDYASLNTNELDFVRNFSLLVLSDTDGAVVREARPPKR